MTTLQAVLHYMVPLALGNPGAEKPWHHLARKKIRSWTLPGQMWKVLIVPFFDWLNDLGGDRHTHRELQSSIAFTATSTHTAVEALPAVAASVKRTNCIFVCKVSFNFYSHIKFCSGYSLGCLRLFGYMGFHLGHKTRAF